MCRDFEFHKTQLHRQWDSDAFEESVVRDRVRLLLRAAYVEMAE